jgi:NTP pyrophosphatase (non-canonical NTP hydrolase)
MNADDFQKQVLQLEYSCNQSRLAHAILGICGESGELASIIKTDDMDVDVLHVLEEAGDVLFYCMLALSAVGYTAGQAMRAVLRKLEHRRAYGKDKDAERGVLLEATQEPEDSGEGAERLVAALAAQMIEHWERSPAARSTFPPEITRLIHAIREADGRKAVAP